MSEVVRISRRIGRHADKAAAALIGSPMIELGVLEEAVEKLGDIVDDTMRLLERSANMRTRTVNDTYRELRKLRDTLWKTAGREGYDETFDD